MGGTDPGWGFPSPATPEGSSVYYSIRFAATELRDALAAICGWRHELRTILERVSEPEVAAVKLAWWRDELGRTFEGRPSHPLARCLAPVIECRGLPPGPFVDIARAVELELSGRWPLDMPELMTNAERDLGALFELLVRVQGDLDPERIARARRLGIYGSLVYGIRDSGWLIRSGRLGFVPRDLLAGLGIEPTDLTQSAGRQRLPEALALLAGKARTLRCCTDDIAGLPAVVRIRAILLDRLLDELESARFDLADRRLALTPIRKLWHAWRESRR